MVQEGAQCKRTFEEFVALTKILTRKENLLDEKIERDQYYHTNTTVNFVRIPKKESY